jgi:phosphoesterase RecJ-like protein
MLSQVVELVERKSRFAITSHARPDGDSLGSSLGLYWLLRALNKSVDVIMRDEVPVAYARLPGARDIITASNIAAHADAKPYDAVFVIECSDVARPVLQTSPSNSSST